MQIEGLTQNTPEWLVHRLGMVTASRMSDVMAKLKRKDGEAAARRNYRGELVCEILTGRAVEHYVSPAMEDGLEREPIAKEAYSIKFDVEVLPGGFWAHDVIPRLGASPDSLIAEDGLAEFKCPLLTTHLDYLLNEEVPEEYLWQMLTQMACTGRQWCDFVSYNPEMPEKYQLWVKRVPRDNALIAALEAETLHFLEDVIETITKLEAK